MRTLRKLSKGLLDVIRGKSRHSSIKIAVPIERDSIGWCFAHPLPLQSRRKRVESWSESYDRAKTKVRIRFSCQYSYRGKSCELVTRDQDELRLWYHWASTPRPM